MAQDPAQYRLSLFIIIFIHCALLDITVVNQHLVYYRYKLIRQEIIIVYITWVFAETVVLMGIYI